MLEFFLKGGPIMWPLLITSIVAVAVILERIAFIVQERRARNDDIIEAILRAVEKGDIVGALALAPQAASPVARVLSYGLLNRDVSLTNALMRASNKELQRYNRGLSVLDTIITLSPLLGLLGTVTGMIAAFGLMGASQLDAPSAITGGVAEALIATAFGLSIAILSLIPFNYLSSRLEEARHELEDRTTQLELLLLKGGKSAELESIALNSAAQNPAVRLRAREAL